MATSNNSSKGNVAMSAADVAAANRASMLRKAMSQATALCLTLADCRAPELQSQAENIKDVLTRLVLGNKEPKAAPLSTLAHEAITAGELDAMSREDKDAAIVVIGAYQDSMTDDQFRTVSTALFLRDVAAQRAGKALEGTSLFTVPSPAPVATPDTSDALARLLSAYEAAGLSNAEVDAVPDDIIEADLKDGSCMRGLNHAIRSRAVKPAPVARLHGIIAGALTGAAPVQPVKPAAPVAGKPEVKASSTVTATAPVATVSPEPLPSKTYKWCVTCKSRLSSAWSKCPQCKAKSAGLTTTCPIGGLMEDGTKRGGSVPSAPAIAAVAALAAPAPSVKVTETVKASEPSKPALAAQSNGSTTAPSPEPSARELLKASFLATKTREEATALLSGKGKDVLNTLWADTYGNNKRMKGGFVSPESLTKRLLAEQFKGQAFVKPAKAEKTSSPKAEPTTAPALSPDGKYNVNVMCSTAERQALIARLIASVKGMSNEELALFIDTASIQDD